MNEFGSPLLWFSVHLSSFIVFLAAFAAGVINSIAGGGTLISFPALVWLGRNPILANATNAAALWPGSFAGMVGFRKDLATLPRWLFWLAIPSLLGLVCLFVYPIGKELGQRIQAELETRRAAFAKSSREVPVS